MSARVPAKVFERPEIRSASRAAVGVAMDMVRLSPPAFAAVASTVRSAPQGSEFLN